MARNGGEDGGEIKDILNKKLLPIPQILEGYNILLTLMSLVIMKHINSAES